MKFFDYWLFKWRIDDCFILSIFTILITYQPFTIIGEVNFYEMGIYFPGIAAVLKGLVPYRDFFQWRGPLELYIPALAMKVFGKEFFILPYYFYIGTIITLLGCVLIGKALYRSRLIYYLATIVIVARTFPRVYYNNWGGFRFAFGIFCLWCLVKYMEKRKGAFLIAAGILAACSFLTSSETGIAAFAAGCSMFFTLFILYPKNWKVEFKSLLVFILSFLFIVGAYLTYLHSVDALKPFFDMQFSVATKMIKTFDPKYDFVYPKNAFEIMLAFFPKSPNFKHMTPVYTYLFFAGLFAYLWKKNRLPLLTPALVAIASYGLILYLAAWRKIENAQFEMALQPSKLLLFFMLEFIYLSLVSMKSKLVQSKNRSAKLKLGIIWVVIFSLIGSSVGFAVSKFNHRFIAFKMMQKWLAGKGVEKFNPLYGVKSKSPLIKGFSGVVLPEKQAKELEEIFNFFERNTKKDELVFMYPEYAFYVYLIDRPLANRFPMATFSWINDDWHQELLNDLITKKPRYAVVPLKLPDSFERSYFPVESNRKKFNDITEILKKEYHQIASTEFSLILEHI